MTDGPPGGSSAPHAQPSQGEPAAPQTAPGSTTMATLSLVFGLSGIIPMFGVALGLVGFVLGIVVVGTKRSGTGLAVGGIIAAMVGTLLGQIFIAHLMFTCWSLSGPDTLPKRAASEANLNAIRLAAMHYGAEHDGAYPPDLQVLVRDGFVKDKTLKCRRARSDRACDYFYLPPPGEAKPDPEALLACELAGPHTGQGRNAVLINGAVKWYSPEQFQAELARPTNAAFAAALRADEGR